MISRRTVARIGDFYAERFKEYRSMNGYAVGSVALYDHLFVHEFPAYLCNSARRLRGQPRVIKDFVMQLHTGESLTAATKEWSWESRRSLGQKHLLELVRACVLDQPSLEGFKRKSLDPILRDVLAGLELDGYRWTEGRFLIPEDEALETQDSQGVLETLYVELKLSDLPVMLHHLTLSESHYIDERWDDVIGNARKFVERVLLSVALRHAQVAQTTLKRGAQARPEGVRQYLETHKLLDAQERKALAETYGVLSAQGGHPFIAEKDQARLLRHLALTYSQFVMLRLKGWLKVNGA